MSTMTLTMNSKIKELETAIEDKNAARISELRAELKDEGIEFKINSKNGFVVYRSPRDK